MASSIDILTTISNLATVMCMPAEPEILRDLHEDNRLYSAILVSVWEIGEAVGPLFTAPLSEIFGRLPVYHSTNIIFIVFSLACAVSTNISELIVFRLLAGIGDASIALNASIAGDLFVDSERGLPVALMSFPALIGPVFGPIIGGYLSEAAGWRWTFWLCVILGGLSEIGFIVFFRETYKPAILRARAKKMRSDGIQASSQYDFDLKHSRKRILLRNIVRPVQMFVQSPVVLMLSAYISAVYGILYILLTTLTWVFREEYGFSQGESGLSYLGLGIGMTIGVALCALTLDRLFNRYKEKHGVATPESRLPPMLLGAVLLPAGLFLYGWTVQYHVFWLVPLIGTATVGFAFFVTTVPLQSYLVDGYPEYAASAIAATVVTRCIVGAFLPLAGPPLYSNLQYGWGNSVLGFIALAFMPAPLLFMKYGGRIRARTTLRLVR